MIEHLPSDWRRATLVGRLLTREGPTPVVIVDGRVRDVSRHAATVSQLMNGWNGDVPAGADLGPLESFAFTRCFENPKDVRLLSPFDLQCIKASGVTFAISAMERVIEERCRGDASKAEALRGSLRERIGTDIRSVKPGSEDAGKLKAAPIIGGPWWFSIFGRSWITIYMSFGCRAMKFW
jgi:fumarylacetoacetate (FAA) hydrolase family protein